MTTLLGMSQPSVLYQLVEARLDSTLADYVAGQREKSVSWRNMAADLRGRTGLPINHETLRLWFADRLQTKVVVVDAPAGAA